MLRSVSILVLLGAAILGSGTVASAQPAGIAAPPQVAAAKREIEGFCEGRTTYGPKFQTVADVSGDGRPDFILDYGEAQCSEGTNGFCGSAGCTLQVLVSTPNGYVDGFNSNVRSWTLQEDKGKTFLALGLHGSACGKVGAASCHKRLAWNGKTFAPARRR